jgi:cell shape-determining protein MreC
VAANSICSRAELLIARYRPVAADPELDQLRTTLAAWKSRSLQESGQEIGRVQQASAETQAQVPAELRAAAPPLLRMSLIPAAILGREPDVLKARFARILDRGRGSDVAVDDVVLADAAHLDQGADSGVQPDQPVVSGRIVVGSIRQVGQWTSALQLITDPQYRAGVQLVRTARGRLVLGATGVLHGNGDGTCRIELVPGQAAVSIGDFVFTRQQDGGSPEPLYFGRVVEAETASGSEDWMIRVQPAFDPAVLKTVDILAVSLNPDRLPSAAAQADAGSAQHPELQAVPPIPSISGQH